MPKLSLKATLEIIDRVTRPLKRVSQQSKQLSNDLKESAKAVKNLERQMGDVRAFKNLQSELGKTNTKLKAAVQEEARLAAAMRATQAPTKAMQRDMAAATQAVAKLRFAQGEQITQLANLKNKLQSTGFETKGFAAAETRLAERLRMATTAMQAQKEKLKEMEIQQRKVTAAQEQFNTAKKKGDNLRNTGFGAVVTGGGMLAGLNVPVSAAKAYELQQAKLQVTGVAEPVVQHAMHLADHNTIKGISKQAALEVFTEGQIIMRDPHEVEELLPNLLKSKYILETLYQSQGHQNASGEADSQLRDMIKTIELRGGTKSVAAFQEQQDYMMRAILGSGGVLKSTDWLDAIKTGGVATKMMNNEAFYYILGHMIQESGGFRAGTGTMSAFSNLTLGRTTQQAAEFLAEQGIINKDQVIYGKTGHITKVLPGAMKSADLLNKSPFEWLMKELVPRLNPKGKLSEDQVKMKIAQAFSSRTAGNNFVQMYTDRLNIARQLAAYRGSYNTEQAYVATGNTTAGRDAELHAKLETLKIDLGTALLPLYVKAVDWTLRLVKAMTQFTEKHPVLTKALLSAAAVIGVVVLATGGLLIVIAAILMPLIHLRLGFVLLRLAFGGALMNSMLFRGGLFLLRGAFSIVTGTMTLFRGMLFMVRLAFLQTFTSIGAMTGALGILAQAAAVFAAAYAGWKAGGAIYKYQQEKWNDPLGKSVVETMAFLGSENAKRMKELGYGFSQPQQIDHSKKIVKPSETPVMLPGAVNPTIPIKTKTVSPFRPGMAASGQQINHFAAANISITGVTDPKEVGTIVDQKLQQFQLAQAATQRRSYSDQA